MRFSVIAMLACVTAVVAHEGGSGTHNAARSQPSSTSWTGYTCPDTDSHGHSKADWGCDSPPYSSSTIGCTYRTGTGTGTYTCSYDADSGSCKSKDSRCASAATHSSQRHNKRNPHAAPPTPGRFAKRSDLFH